MSAMNDNPRFSKFVHPDAPTPDVTPPSAEDLEEVELQFEVNRYKTQLRAREIANREFEAERHTKAAASSTRGAQRLLTGGAGILDQPDLPDAVWGDGSRIAWASGQGTMIAAPQGVGKSTLAQNLIFRRMGLIAEPLLGMPVQVSESTILYLAMDRPVQALQSMKRMVRPEMRELLDERMVIWTGPLPFSLVAEPLRLAEWVQEVAPGCRTVVIDSVKDMAAGISKDEIGAAVNTAWQELIANGVEVLALHHQRKGQQGQAKVGSMDDIYGSTWLTSGLGSVFTIDGETGSSVVTLKHLKTVVEMLDDTPVKIDMATGLMHLHDESSFMTLAEALKQAGTRGLTARDAAERVLGTDGTSEVRRMKRELNKLVDLTVATKMERPSGASAKEPDRWRLIHPGGGQQSESASAGGGGRWNRLVDDLYL